MFLSSLLSPTRPLGVSNHLNHYNLWFTYSGDIWVSQSVLMVHSHPVPESLQQQVHSLQQLELQPLLEVRERPERRVGDPDPGQSIHLLPQVPQRLHERVALLQHAPPRRALVPESHEAPPDRPLQGHLADKVYGQFAMKADTSPQENGNNTTIFQIHIKVKGQMIH